jgi:UDP:flavonoid glycosyltransferase YjiC (YdhE family)
MKVVLVGYGSRGDIEPLAATARELLRRGHEVRMAVPPNMLGFVEPVGLTAVAYGPDSREAMNPAMDFIRDLPAKMQNPVGMLTEVIENVSRVKAGKSSTLTELASGADLLVAGFNEQGVAANVADYHGIPLAALHFFPTRIWASGELALGITKQTDDAQRPVLGLSEATEPSTTLEIQAYDELCLPGPAAEWLEPDGQRRPFVGALTLELPGDADDEVLSWIAEGTPPIYFGFGSTPIVSPAETVAVISAACARLGERALICSGANDFADVPHFHNVKVVGEVNHAAIFPACRAVVHHGGAGATAAGMRAGIPTLILWFWLDQPMWADGVTRLKTGSGRQFHASTLDSLVADLRCILAPEYATRAREVAGKMTKSAASVVTVADLLEETARLRVG